MTVMIMEPKTVYEVNVYTITKVTGSAGGITDLTIYIHIKYLKQWETKKNF